MGLQILGRRTNNPTGQGQVVKAVRRRYVGRGIRGTCDVASSGGCAGDQRMGDVDGGRDGWFLPSRKGIIRREGWEKGGNHHT